MLWSGPQLVRQVDGYNSCEALRRERQVWGISEEAGTWVKSSSSQSVALASPLLSDSLSVRILLCRGPEVRQGIHPALPCL